MQRAISVASLQPSDKEGWLKKQGEHYRTWRKRWFVLKGRQLVYFESQKVLIEILCKMIITIKYLLKKLM